MQSPALRPRGLQPPTLVKSYLNPNYSVSWSAGVLIVNITLTLITHEVMLIGLMVSNVYCCRECEVFSKNHAAPFSKVITFHKKEPFDLEAYYTHPHEVPYPDSRIGKDMGIKPLSLAPFDTGKSGSPLL